MGVSNGAAVMAPRHKRFVRVTHWLTTIAFFSLLLSGFELVLSHPRFYWGEIGNVNTTPLFSIPVPSSRRTVPTGYGFVLPDQNGWSRNLHFQSAWLLLFTGLVYVWAGLRSSSIEACCGVRLALRVLQRMQEQTMFSHVVGPPRSRGIT